MTAFVSAQGSLTATRSLGGPSPRGAEVGYSAPRLVPGQEPRAIVVDEAQELTDAECQMELHRRIDPEPFGKGIEAAVDRYVTMARATQQLVILTSS